MAVGAAAARAPRARAGARVGARVGVLVVGGGWTVGRCERL